MATDGTRCRQDDVAARARARELAVSRVNRARAQLGAGDALKAEQEIPRKFSPGYEMTCFGYVLVERLGRTLNNVFDFLELRFPPRYL